MADSTMTREHEQEFDDDAPREACRACRFCSAGGLTIHGEVFVVETDQRVELVDLTNRVMEFARRFNIREGLFHLWSMHTTCTLFINEFQTALLSDIKQFLEQWSRVTPSGCTTIPAFRLRPDERRRAPPRDAARPQSDAASQWWGSRAGAMAADPAGRARRPSRAIHPRPGLELRRRPRGSRPIG